MKNITIKILTSILCVFCFSFFVFAQEGNQVKVEDSELVEYDMSLNEITNLALKNNFDIQLAKYDTLIARTQEGVSESVYDAIIEAEVEYTRNESKRASTLIGTKSLDNDYIIGISKKLPTGTTITIDSKNNRNWTDSAFTNTNPSHDSSLGVSVTQELGKNFFGIQDRGNVKITRLDIENSEITSIDRIENNIAEVQKAYWDLVLQIEKMQIAKDMVDQSKKLYDLNQEKLKDGLVEKPDVLASEANYKSRINDLIYEENQFKTKENVLKLLLNITENEGVIVPRDSFSLDNNSEKLDESLNLAFKNRYDYKQAVNDIKSKDIKLSMKKNNVWPEVNLTASLRKNGVADHFKQAYEQITEEDNPTLFAGLTITMPFENTKAKSELKAAELQKAKSLVYLKLLERKISIQIIDQVRLCNVLKQLAINDESIAELQSEKLIEEGKRFSLGRSDTDTLIRFQDDSTLAQSNAVQSKFKYYSAVIDLRKMESNLLNKYWDLEI